MKASLINNTITYLLNFERYSSFPQALKEMAISNSIQVVLMNEEFNPLMVVETKYDATVDDAISLGKAAAFGLGSDYRLIDVKGIKTYWGTTTINGEKFYLFIVDNDDNYSTEDMTLLAELIEISMAMWKYTPIRDEKIEFLKSIVRGNRTLAISIQDEVGVREDEILSVFSARGLNNEESERIIQEYLDTKLITIIYYTEDKETKGIILRGEIPTPNEETTGKAVVLRLYEKLKAAPGVKIFHVTGLGGIDGACEGFRTISDTAPYTESIFPYKRVFSKYELVLAANCISIQMQGGKVRKSYTDLLLPFRKEGDNKAKQLLDTLETFVLDAGMNASKTSEFLGIHTNTVQYRLKKINDMLGVDITANRVIPGLTLALALRRIESLTK